MFELILETVAASAIAATIASILAKKLLDHRLGKDIESYKASLKAESDSSLERLRSSIRGEELVFREAHVRRVEIVAEMYSLMVDAIAAFEPCCRAAKEEDHQVRWEQYQRESEPIRKFRSFFKRNRIWFSSGLANRIDKFNKDHVEGFMGEFYNLSDMDKRGLGKNFVPQKLTSWHSELHSQAYLRTLSSLEQEFRSILGIEDSPPSDEEVGEPEKRYS